ncbi:MAG: penicillin acylase family protein [Bacillota bacterium]
MQTDISQKDLEEVIPPVEGRVEVVGSDGPIHIRRDAWGIPHVEATTPADAFFGQGYAAAADRLYHMDSDRLRAMGRWAEMMGEDAVESDILMRRMGLAGAARRDFSRLKPATRGMLRAYSAGVNSFIQNAKKLPIEHQMLGTTPEPWKPWHCIAVFLVRHVSMGSRERKVFRAQIVNALGAEKAAALFPGYPEGHPVILPPGEEYRPEKIDRALEAFRKEQDNLRWLGDGLDGSNNWVISGDRTESGLPLMAGDPHRALEVPNTYWQNHLASPEFETIGLSFPGVPGFPHFGHNDDVAWCITHTGVDNQDLYIERFADGHYLYHGEWLRPETRWETIRVRDGEDREIQICETRNGAIISGETEEGYGLSFRWAATEEFNTTLDCFVPMMAARDADDLEYAVHDWVDPCNNLLFADVGGNIGYRVRGKLPVRTTDAGWTPLPGWTGEGDWSGYVPFAEMPAARESDVGFFATANNKVVRDDYPHYIAVDFAPGYRATRLFEILKERDNFAVEDMPTIHSDIMSVAAREFTALISEIELEKEPTQWARDVLSQWNGEMRAGDVEPTVYSVFREMLVDEVLRGLLGRKMHTIMGGESGVRMRSRLRPAIISAMARDDRKLLPEGLSWSNMLRRALKRSIESLKNNLGTEESQWRWGNVHRTAPSHPLRDVPSEGAYLLDPPGFPMSGDSDTVQAAAYMPGQGFTVTGTSVARYAFDLSNWNRCGWIVPLGSSGHPASIHYTDQANSWADHRLIPMLYDWEEIENGCEGTLTLVPRQ